MVSTVSLPLPPESDPHKRTLVNSSVSGNFENRLNQKTIRKMRAITLTALYIFLLTKISAQPENKKLKITPLSGNFYVYTTYNLYEGNHIPAHGMYVITAGGALLFDTPWDTTQFQPLLDSIQLKHNKRVKICIATHWHSDRTEGLEFYKKQGIKTYTTALTDKLCKENNKKRAEFLMTKDTVFTFGQYAFEVYYPGEGHTSDNVIAWFNKEKILYGGCLIKGAEAESLGYLGDANSSEYETTLKKVQKKCSNPKFIIVSHHDWVNTGSLKHSIKLAKKLKKNNGLSH
jgi:metallo-beta-lactamase class B